MSRHDHAHPQAHSKDHSHDHDHDHDHSHTPTVSGDNARRIRLVFVLTLGYAIVQAVGGWLSGSLALIADSAHMLSDAAALLLALVAYRLARRPADRHRTYGWHRVRVLAALANGATLLLLVVWITWEAVQRFNNPSPVMAWPMLIVASIGLLVNVAGAWILLAGNRQDGNLRGALLHVIGDLLGSVGAIAAAIGILLTGWHVLDPILSVLVSLLVVRAAWRLVKDSLRVLMQATPPGIDAEAIETLLRQHPDIEQAAHAHAWTLTDQSTVATVHVSAADGVDPLGLPETVAELLRERFGIDHVTVQPHPTGGLAAARGDCSI